MVLCTLAVAGCVACGDDSPAAPSANPGSPTTSNTFTIADATVTPTTLVIQAGERVVFVNTDDVDHDMSSDKHPTHLDCPAINQAGFLRPGESRESGNFVRAETCAFHDHLNPDKSSMRGMIVVTE